MPPGRRCRDAGRAGPGTGHEPAGDRRDRPAAGLPGSFPGHGLDTGSRPCGCRHAHRARHPRGARARPQPSQLLAFKLLDARAAGITCIAGAGDTGTTTAFPASHPTVIAVGALAHTGTTPPDHQAGHRQPAWPGPYTPAFTPADGTALAAAHVTGLAALLLAHHDHLRTHPQPRSATRVDQLHALLHTSCRPLPTTDPARTGAGLPDAPTALGLPTTPTGQPTYSDPDILHVGLHHTGPRQ